MLILNKMLKLEEEEKESTYNLEIYSQRYSFSS